MQKRVLSIAGIVWLSLSCLFGCNNVTNTAGTYENETTVTSGGALTETQQPTVVPKKTEKAVRMARVDGKLYRDTGKETEGGTCGVMDGTITSTVTEGEVPRKNDQSNFGKGYKYQYGTEGKIDIVIDGKWICFAKVTEKKN